jgi:hypothetical protein
MIVTATDLANDSKAVIDCVLSRHESADVHRHGKAIVEIRRKAGVSGRELAGRMASVRFTGEESRELKQVMLDSCKVFDYAGGH